MLASNDAGVKREISPAPAFSGRATRWPGSKPPGKRSAVPPSRARSGAVSLNGTMIDLANVRMTRVVLETESPGAIDSQQETNIR